MSTHSHTATHPLTQEAEEDASFDVCVRVSGVQAVVVDDILGLHLPFFKVTRRTSVHMHTLHTRTATHAHACAIPCGCAGVLWLCLWLCLWLYCAELCCGYGCACGYTVKFACTTECEHSEHAPSAQTAIMVVYI